MPGTAFSPGAAEHPSDPTPQQSQTVDGTICDRQAEAAVDALEIFLRDRHRADGNDTADVSSHIIAAREATPEDPGPDTQVTGEPALIPVSQLAATGQTPPLRLPHTDWLHHRLTVTGPVVAIESFWQAACGAGTIPWQLDLASLEEDWFHRLVDPAYRRLSVQGARVLAGQLREAVERRHAIAVARVGHSHACPFDLHSLLPVPCPVLALGPDHPDSFFWLWEHWGTTQALRHVTVDTAQEGQRRPEPSAPEWHLQFWSADWTPWRAIAHLRATWPALLFDVQPSYD